MYDVITFGSSTIDVFARTEKSDLISIRSQNPNDNEQFLAYPVGDKILVDELVFTTGGGGTNTAVSMSKLGLTVAYCGKVGRSENGHMIIDMLKRENVDFIGALSDKMSGYSIILDSIKHDRTILTYKGCNNDFKFSEIDKRNLKAKWFYCCAMVEKSFKELEKVAIYAKKNNIKVMFNPSSYLADKGIKYLSKILKCTDILVLNKEEAECLVGKQDHKTLVKLLKQYMNINTVIITDGKNGVFVGNAKYYYGHPTSVKVVETTGAGDAFGSSFLAGLIIKNDIEFAIRLAITNAESVICHHGAKNKLLTYPEALKIMKKRPVKVVINKL